MTMHLVNPSLSTTGKRKGKQKFRNADAAKKARELVTSWEALKKEHNVTTQKKKRKRALSAEIYNPVRISYRGSELPRIPSRETTWDPCTKAPDKIYTGTAIVGISTMHKSNAVPVFSIQAAIDISKMRR